MFRSLRKLTLSCPLRSLLLREYYAATCSEHAGATWQAARALKERSNEVIHRCKEGSSFFPETLQCSTQLPLLSSDSEDEKLRETSFNNLSFKAFLSCHCHQCPQVSAAAKAKQEFSSWNCTLVKDLSPNSLISSSCLQSRRRPVCQTLSSLTAKTCKLLHSYSDHRGHLVRHFSLCTDQRWMLSQPLSKPHLTSVFLHQTRGASQAAPHEAGSLRDCLSPENENRCRQCLGPNLKLYDTDKQRKGWIQSKGKSQARWASVLVSLCSVHGEPAFLFTLRSSALKGRHKGDVSFAGGKSDPSDRDVVATALREAREELGVNVAAENVWGILRPLRDKSGMMIAPVLANLGAIEELSFKPNPGEVEEIFTLSVSHLCNPENRGYTHFRTGDKYGYTLPVFRNGKHRVWGLTAIALDHTLKLLVPQQQVE